MSTGAGDASVGDANTSDPSSTGTSTGDPERCATLEKDTGLTAADLAIGGCLVAPTMPKVHVLRDAGGFFAMTNECTHNGCAVKCADANGILKCPCHGSWFDFNGDVIKGPAPIYLDHLRLVFCGEGPTARIFVDAAVIVADRTTRSLP